MKWHQWTVLAVLAGGIGIGSAGRAGAEDNPPAPSGLTLEALDQKVKALEQKLEKAGQETPVKAGSGVKVQVAPGEGGLVISSNEEGFKAKIGGYAQFDGRFYFKDKATPAQAANTFLMRRARINLEATYLKEFTFRLVPDFGGGATVLQDAYGEYKPISEFGIRLGKFKTPIDIERLQSDLSYLFVETALTSALTPNRDVGIQVQGDMKGGVVSYAAGVFDGVADGGIQDTDTGSDKDVAGRVFVQPFKTEEAHPLQGLGVGVASSYGKKLGASALPTFRTDGQQVFFSYGTTVIGRGEHFRFVPQAYYHWNSFGLLSEYALSTQEAQNGAARKKFGHKAWQVATTFVLTGEKASLGGVTPKEPFDPRQGQWGAVEIGARYAGLAVDPEVFSSGFASLTTSARKAGAFTTGLSWVLNKSVRVIADYTQTQFKGGAGTTTRPADRENENVLLSRVQFVF